MKSQISFDRQEAIFHSPVSQLSDRPQDASQVQWGVVSVYGYYWLGPSRNTPGLGQIEYLDQSNDNADIVSPDDRFRYSDDLSVLQLICLSGLIKDYDFQEHMASDVGVDKPIPPS